MHKIILGDNLKVLPTLPEAFASLIYIDPPFNTGTTQQRKRIQVEASSTGDRVGFGGRQYKTTERQREGCRLQAAGESLPRG